MEAPKGIEAVKDNPNAKGRKAYCPDDAIGKRIHGVMRNGWVFGVKPVAPLGWAADGRHGCRWSKVGNDFDIMKYEVING